MGMIGLKELDKLYKRAPGDLPKEGDLADLFGLSRVPLPEAEEDFDSETWEEDHDFRTLEPGQGKGYFDDRWGKDLDEQEVLDAKEGADCDGEDDGDEDEFEDSFRTDDVELQRRWEASMMEASESTEGVQADAAD